MAYLDIALRSGIVLVFIQCVLPKLSEPRNASVTLEFTPAFIQYNMVTTSDPWRKFVDQQHRHRLLDKKSAQTTTTTSSCTTPKWNTSMDKKLRLWFRQLPTTTFAKVAEQSRKVKMLTILEPCLSYHQKR